MNRRDFIKLSLLGAGALLGRGLVSEVDITESSNVKRVISDQDVKAMDLNITYVTEIINPPKHEAWVNLWIPLPQSDSEQKITKLEVESPVPFNINEEPRYGNKMVYVGPVPLKGGDKVSLTYRLKRKTVGTTVERDEDIKKHLILTERERWNSDITAFVDGLVGNETEPVEIGRRIYHRLVEYLTYDKKIPGCGQGISRWIFEQRRGKCDDFHALFRTMMIYKGIPVRWEQGISLPYPSDITEKGEFEGDCFGAHCWVRFYAGDGRWMPVDASEANKRKDLKDFFFGNLTPNRFKVSTGRDVTLKPAQAGEPLNTFPYAYGEYDGIPLIYGHHYRNRIRYELMEIET